MWPKEHKAADCWDNDKDKDKHISYYKTPAEKNKTSSAANIASYAIPNSTSPNATANATIDQEIFFVTTVKKIIIQMIEVSKS
jgi:hypothetical protein